MQVMCVIFILDGPTHGMLFTQVSISCILLWMAFTLFTSSLENGKHDMSSFLRMFVYALTTVV